MALSAFIFLKREACFRADFVKGLFSLWGNNVGTDAHDIFYTFVMYTKTTISANERGLHDTPNNPGTVIAVRSARCRCLGTVLNKMMAQNNLQEIFLEMKQLKHWSPSFTLYGEPVLVWSFAASSISRKQNLNSTRCRTSHLRSFEHSSVFSTSSLQRSIALVRSSIVASWSNTNCHCSLIKLLGIACDLSDASSPDTDACVSFSIDWLICVAKMLQSIGDVPSIGDDAFVFVVMKLLNAFGMFAKFPRNDCIFCCFTSLYPSYSFELIFFIDNKAKISCCNSSFTKLWILLWQINSNLTLWC